VAAAPYWVFHPFGVEQRRADTLRRAAALADRLERCADTVEATRRLTAIPGIGPWTAAEVVRIAYGDPDAVSVGDYHIPNTVAWALAGEPRGDDARMLALLEPFRGHRGRVCLLLEAAGVRAPAYGPRAPIRSFARF
jgi:3-methyladenine DNA glycosylase/8-oxoguanine DNA glycosylase